MTLSAAKRTVIPQTDEPLWPESARDVIRPGGASWRQLWKSLTRCPTTAGSIQRRELGKPGATLPSTESKANAQPRPTGVALVSLDERSEEGHSRQQVDCDGRHASGKYGGDHRSRQIEHHRTTCNTFAGRGQRGRAR